MIRQLLLALTILICSNSTFAQQASVPTLIVRLDHGAIGGTFEPKYEAEWMASAKRELIAAKMEPGIVVFVGTDNSQRAYIWRGGLDPAELIYQCLRTTCETDFSGEQGSRGTDGGGSTGADGGGGTYYAGEGGWAGQYGGGQCGRVDGGALHCAYW